ncbi:MAG TPA: ATP-binding protein [Chryseolinea sp.]|nr:ATP-binding protein [Chryseolinea sp.]
MRNINATDLKLRERVKELNCLYEISKVAWEANNDLETLISSALQIIPAAMQYPELAETEIRIADVKYSTSRFAKRKFTIEAKLNIDKKVYGSIRIGYRSSGKVKGKLTFLPEERSLLKTVAHELSLFIRKRSVEDEKQKLQVQLQHVERLAFVGELSAGIAHELNEPLAKILGFAQLIKKTGNLEDQQAEDIERIVKASLYTREIIKKLMIFSRQMPPQITKVNLNEIIGNILYFIDVRFQSRGIKLKTKLDNNLPVMKGDEVQMSQVLVNLITNAVHAMPEGGDITVATKAKGKFISLLVSDTGSGMGPETKQRIFEPFFTTKPVGQGTGLGLSVVKGIIDSHHGKIVVNSTAGKGTKFEILLPLN